MQNLATKTIREIAVELPATTRVFEEFKIDFCCGGGYKFHDACRRAGVEPELVSHQIEHVLIGSAELESPAAKSASELIDHIVEKHHVFTKAEITRLSALMEKVRRKHGATHPELYFLENAVFALFAELSPHMMKEENMLFPFIKHLEASAERDLSLPKPPFGTVKNPVRMMIVEHDLAGEILRKIREITNDFALPENACPSFGALYFGLEELEKDLHLHIHLENNVLFPKSRHTRTKSYVRKLSRKLSN